MQENLINISNEQRIYLVPHPKRSTKNINITDSKNNTNISVTIRYDTFEKNYNEDPFIWSHNFLYSFCHVGRFNFKEDDIYIFLSPDDNDNGPRTVIDTIIQCSDVISWPTPDIKIVKNKKGESKTKYLYPIKKIQNAFLDSEIKINLDQINHHIPGPSQIIKDVIRLDTHNNKKIQTCVGDPNKSFLPITEHRQPLDLKKYISFEEIDKRIGQTNTNTRIHRSKDLNKEADKTFVTKLIDIINENTEYAILGSDLIKKDSSRGELKRIKGILSC